MFGCLKLMWIFNNVLALAFGTFESRFYIRCVSLSIGYDKCKYVLEIGLLIIYVHIYLLKIFEAKRRESMIQFFWGC